jgi:hypothetical protein
MKKNLKIDLPEFVEIGDNKLKNLFKILLFHRLKFKKVLLSGDSKTFLLGGETIASIFKKEKIKILSGFRNQRQKQYTNQPHNQSTSWSNC